MMIPIKVPSTPPQTSLRTSAGMDPEGSLYRQQNRAFTTAAHAYSMPKGHSSNCPRKMVFSVSGTELHRYPFLFPPFPPGWSKQVRQDPGPRMSSHTSSTTSNLKHNFFSLPPIFQDDLGSLQKNYGFASTAVPSWKFIFKHKVQSPLLLPLLLPLQDKRREQAKC